MSVKMTMAILLLLQFLSIYVLIFCLKGELKDRLKDCKKRGNGRYVNGDFSQFLQLMEAFLVMLSDLALIGFAIVYFVLTWIAIITLYGRGGVIA